MTETAKTERFACSKCGGTLDLYAGDETETIVCQYCGAVFDFSGPQGQRLAHYREKISVAAKPIVPLGTGGVLHGEQLTVIGFMVRKAVIDESTYRWREYLLYTSTREFRWLTEYDGHWTYVRMVRDVPKLSGHAAPEAVHRNLTYKHFQTSTAVVDYVVGEFYWQVKEGEQARCQDFVCPPFILSSETTKNEITWSQGIYVEPKDIWAAFKLTTPQKTPVGIFANQPNPYEPYINRGRTLGIAFCAAAILIYASISNAAKNRQVDYESFGYSPADLEKSHVTNIFTLDGHTSNLKVNVSAGFQNAWAYFGMALINADTDEALDFGKEVSWYYGSDSDGPWSEGSNYAHVYLPSIHPGRYYLRIEPETDATTPPFNYAIEVYQDVPRFWYLLFALLLLGLPLIWTELCNYNFEVKRWAESDHPMTYQEEE